MSTRSVSALAIGLCLVILTGAIIAGSGLRQPASLSAVRLPSPSTQVAQVAQSSCSPVCGGLVGYWPFDDGSGTAAADASGSGDNGSLLPSSNPPSWATGWNGTALSFGGSQLVSVPASSQFDFSNDFSVSLWVKASSPVGTVIGRSLNNLSTLWRIDGGNFEYYPSAGNVWRPIRRRLSQTAHGISITVTLSSTTLTFYLDGNAGTPVTVSGVPALSGIPISIGAARNDGLDGFTGTVDDVRVYSRALSAAEVQSLYSAARLAGFAIIGLFRIFGQLGLVRKLGLGFWDRDPAHLILSAPDTQRRPCRRA